METSPGNFPLLMIVIPLVAIVITAVSVFFAMRKVKSTLAQAGVLPDPLMEQLRHTGVQAQATITRLDMGQMTVIRGGHRHLQVVLQLTVQRPDVPAYASQLTTTISELNIPQVQPGCTIQVRVDRANPHRLLHVG